jgi:hypothetical protein
MNSIMRTVGGSFGGQIAASVLTASTAVAGGLPSEQAFTLALVITAGATALGLVPTLLLGGARRARAATPALAGARA